MTEPKPPEADSDERSSPLASLLTVWRAIRKNWLLVFAVTLAVASGATFFTLSQKKIYRAEGTIQIDPRPPRPLGDEVKGVVEMGTSAYLNNREYYETQYRIIKSMRVATAVVRELSLHRDGAFLAEATPGDEVAPREVPVEVAAKLLISRTELEPEKHSRICGVAYQDADPERARRIASAIIDEYRRQNVDQVMSSTATAVDWLNDQLDKLKDELEESELALHAYKKEKNILSVSIDDQTNMLREEMTLLNHALTDARTREQELAARHQELSKVDPANPSNLPAQELLSDKILNSLRTRYIEALNDLKSLRAIGKGEQHPAVASAAARVETTRTELFEEIKNIKGAVEHELRAVRRNIEGLEGLNERAKQKGLELNLLEIKYNRLKRSKNMTERLYSVVLERTKDSDLTRMMRVNNIHVVDAPLLPKVPVKPSLTLNVGVGVAAGLMLGFFFAFGRELLDRSVKSPEDVERELGISVLGLLPQVGDETVSAYYSAKANPRPRHRKREQELTKNRELIIHEHPASAVAEAARAIRTNILFMSPDEPYRRLLVTSAAPQEGKTTVACSIAITMAQAGHRVLLIDCDMRRPRVHRIFDQSNAEGVTTALLDLSSLDRVVTKTEVANLSILPCGPIPPNPSELLHSDSFGRLLERVGAQFDRVIIDSPPLVPVTDAAILSTRVDGTVVVVRAFRTSKDVAKIAIRSLRDVAGRIVGGVVNAVDAGRKDYGYYRYYYYRRQGYGDAEVAQKVDVA